MFRSNFLFDYVDIVFTRCPPDTKNPERFLFYLSTLVITFRINFSKKKLYKCTWMIFLLLKKNVGFFEAERYPVDINDNREGRIKGGGEGGSCVVLFVTSRRLHWRDSRQDPRHLTSLPHPPASSCFFSISFPPCLSLAGPPFNGPFFRVLRRYSRKTPPRDGHPDRRWPMEIPPPAPVDRIVASNCFGGARCIGPRKSGLCPPWRGPPGRGHATSACWSSVSEAMVARCRASDLLYTYDFEVINSWRPLLCGANFRFFIWSMILKDRFSIEFEIWNY